MDHPDSQRKAFCQRAEPISQDHEIKRFFISVGCSQMGRFRPARRAGADGADGEERAGARRSRAPMRSAGETRVSDAAVDALPARHGPRAQGPEGARRGTRSAGGAQSRAEEVAQLGQVRERRCARSTRRTRPQRDRLVRALSLDLSPRVQREVPDATRQCSGRSSAYQRPSGSRTRLISAPFDKRARKPTSPRSSNDGS